MSSAAARVRWSWEMRSASSPVTGVDFLLRSILNRGCLLICRDFAELRVDNAVKPDSGGGDQLARVEVQLFRHLADLADLGLAVDVEVLDHDPLLRREPVDVRQML